MQLLAGYKTLIVNGLTLIGLVIAAILQGDVSHFDPVVLYWGGIILVVVNVILRFLTIGPVATPVPKKAPRLGALHATVDARTFKLSKYLNATEVAATDFPPPPVLNWSRKVEQYDMDGNDIYGDCVVAAAKHQGQVISATVTNSFKMTKAAVINLYFKLTGGPDSGLDPMVMLSHWRKTGLYKGGHKIRAYVQVNLFDPVELRMAMTLFAGIQLAIDLPVTAQSQFVWDVTSQGLSGQGAPGSWGGHMVWLADYDDVLNNHHFTCVTWGTKKAMTEDFIRSYGYAGFAVLGEEWKTKAKPVAGFNFAQLEADLAAIGA